MQRLDAKALYQALVAQRMSQDLTWQELSRLLGVGASTMQRLSQGRRLEVYGIPGLAF